MLTILFNRPQEAATPGSITINADRGHFLWTGFSAGLFIVNPPPILEVLGGGGGGPYAWEQEHKHKKRKKHAKTLAIAMLLLD